MTHYTITPSNSIYMPTTALTLRAGNDLTVLTGGYLAGDITGLALLGDNAVTIRGEVSGDTGISFAGAVQLAIGTGGAVLGGAHAILGSGEIGIANWGDILTSAKGISAAIQVTGGPAVTLDNHGLIGTAQPPSQNGVPLVVDISSDRFFLTNDGVIAGDVVARTTLYSWIDNRGAIEGLNLTVAGDTRITNTGSLGAVTVTGSGYLEVTGQNAEFGRTDVSMTGGSADVIDFHGLQGSHFSALWVVADGRGDLFLDGTTIDDLNLWGHVSAHLAGARVGSVMVDGGNVDASGLAELRGIFELGAGSERLTGSQLNDGVLDNGGSDWLSLGDGDDSVWQMMWDETGNQTLGGADTIDGGAGYDSYAADPFWLAMRIDLHSHEVGARKAGSPVGVIWNVEEVSGSNFNDFLRGDGRANALFGGDGDDQLVGGGGADTLAGGSGHNRLRGGAGADVFVGSWGGDDLILDFKTGVDSIDLTDFDLDPTQDGHQGLTWGEGPGQALLEVTGETARLHAWMTDGTEVLAMEIHGAVSTADFIL